MFTHVTALAITMLLAIPGVVFADPSTGALETQVALNKSVRYGMTIGEAVRYRIKRSPEDAEKIITTALDMLNRLPTRACIERARNSKVKRSPRPDYKDCRSRIIQAAILAGADPVSVAKASVAGGSTKAYDQSPHKAKDLYLRRLFLLSSS